MYPPVDKYRIVFDKNTSLYKDVLITSWKEKDRAVANKEMFSAYYMFNMYLLSYEGDRVIQIVADGKYLIQKAIDFLLTVEPNELPTLIVNNTIYGNEFELSQIKKMDKAWIYVFDPLEESMKKWGY